MYEYAWHPIIEVVGFLAEEAGVLVDESVDKATDLFLVGIRGVLSLLEEVSGGVLQGLHVCGY